MKDMGDEFCSNFTYTVKIQSLWVCLLDRKKNIPGRELQKSNKKKLRVIIFELACDAK